MKKLSITLILILFIALSGGCTTSQNVSTEVINTRATKFIEKYIEDNNFSGNIFLAKNGNVIFEKSYGMADYEGNISNQATTKFRIGSMTKQFTAMCIMILQERGLLSVNDKLSKFISDFPNGDQISIHNLLSMSSGITNNITGILPNYDLEVGAYITEGKYTLKDEHFTPDQLINLFKDKPLDFKSGTKFEYSNSNYVLLGYIIEKLTNMSYEDFVKSNIFAPLGMENSGNDNNEALSDKALGYVKINPNPVKAISYDMSIFYSCGSLYSTIEDLYKWDQALYTEKLIKKETMESMYKPYTKIEEYPYHSYGYGWIVSDIAKKPKIEHNGHLPGFTSYIYHDETSKDTIIILCNNEDFFLKLSDFTYNISSILNGR
jgi:CubicO group peptidase (beta-lactamase class C family)